MAGKVPVLDTSSTTVPSLVVAAPTAVMAACAVAGVVNCAKLKAIGAFAAKFAARTNTTFKTLPVMVGTHVALEEGAVTAHAGVAPMVGDPESVMMIPDWPAVDVMAVVGVNVTDMVVAVPLIWELRVIVGPVILDEDAPATTSVIAANWPALVESMGTGEVTDKSFEVYA